MSSLVVLWLFGCSTDFLSGYRLGGFPWLVPFISSACFCVVLFFQTSARTSTYQIVSRLKYRLIFLLWAKSNKSSIRLINSYLFRLINSYLYLFLIFMLKRHITKLRIFIYRRVRLNSIHSVKQVKNDTTLIINIISLLILTMLFYLSSSLVLPQSLLQLCRVRIRQFVGIKRLKYIRNLPGRLIRFLNHDVQCEDIL